MARNANISFYNEEQKLRYFKECKYEVTTVELIIKTVFRTACKVEEQEGMDLSEFTTKQIRDLLTTFHSSSRGYLAGACVYFADYYAWCLQEGLVRDPVNKYDVSMTKDMIEDIVPKNLIMQRYFSKEKMLEYIDKIVDVRNKFIAYALFCGVKGEEYEELVNLKIEDLDKENKTLTLSTTGRKIEVDDLFIDLMIKTELSEIYNEDGTFKQDRVGYSEYLQTGYVLKQTKRGDYAPITMSIMKKHMAAIKKQSGNRYVTVNALYKNGLINYIKEDYIKDGIDLESVFFEKIMKHRYTYEERTQKLIDKFGSNTTVRMLRQEIGDYIKYTN